MLNDFLFSVSATLPVFAVMVLGWLLHRTGFLTEGFCKAGNKLMFRLCLPAMLLRQMASMRPADLVDGGFLLYAFTGTLLSVLLFWLLSRHLLRDKTLVGAFAQGSFRGNTALLDAIGLTIRRIANAQRLAPAHLRADRVLFVITTDGMENASREFSREQIRRMIELEKTQYDWEFIFLGANIDAVETASNFGIAPSRASNYRADSRGTRLNFDVLSETVSQMRACGCIAEDWNARIDEDYTDRKE